MERIFEDIFDMIGYQRLLKIWRFGAKLGFCESFEENSKIQRPSAKQAILAGCATIDEGLWYPSTIP